MVRDVRGTSHAGMGETWVDGSGELGPSLRMNLCVHFGRMLGTCTHAHICTQANIGTHAHTCTLTHISKQLNFKLVIETNN